MLTTATELDISALVWDRSEAWEEWFRSEINRAIVSGTLVRQEEERADIIDITGVCAWVTSFLGLTVDASDIADSMTLGLGKPVDADTLKEAARTMHHLERAFTGICGLTREDDRLSKAYYDRIRPKGQPIPELCFTDEELERMKDDYYRLMDWDLKTGLPTRETLEKHGLADVADKLGL